MFNTKDKLPKKVFILGVYASAILAKCLATDGNVNVNALAVVSDPYIFWKGDNAQQIIGGIQIPKEVGNIILKNKRFNE